MIVSTSDWIKVKSYLNDAKMWLFFTTVNLALWQGILTDRINSSQFTTTIFFWLVALFVLWKKKDELEISSQPWRNFVGIFLLAVIIYRGLLLFWYENFVLQFIPFFSLLSIALIASGWKGLKQYFRPLLAFLIFSLVDGISNKLLTSLPESISFTQLTTNFGAFLLHYIGFNIQQEGVLIHLPSGSVEVLYACTGGPLIALLMQLTLVLFIVAPLNWKLGLKIIGGLLALGFFLGVARVALLAVVVSDDAAFAYWHGDEGNQIFSLIAFTAWIVMAHFSYEYYEKQLAQQTSETSEMTAEDDAEVMTTSNAQDHETEEERDSSYPWFLSGLGVVMTALTLMTFLFPEIGRRQVSPLTFPSQISLNGWTRESSAPLSEEEEGQINEYIQEFRSGQEYRYRQEDTEVMVELMHLGGTFGNVNGFTGRYRDLSDFYQKGNSHSMEELGDYQLFHDETNAYLSTCITSQGESTLTIDDFVRKMNRNLLKVNSRLLSGIVGQTSLRERNCLWVTLSTPLQGESVEESYQVLESVFEQGYPKWQGLF